MPQQQSLFETEPARWELDEKLPTGRIVPVEGAFDLRSGADLADLELDDILTSLDADDGGRVRCAVEDLEAGTRTVVEFEREPFPNVVVYTAPAPRSAICVEPMTVPTDAFNLQARGVDANVLRGGPLTTYWLAVDDGRMLRFEGNNSPGTRPVVVDVTGFGPREIAGPPQDQVILVDGIQEIYDGFTGAATG